MSINNINISEIFKNVQADWLKNNTIYLTLHGSHAYGTNRTDSDIDIRGIAIPPRRYFFGVLDNFEQSTVSEPYDCVIFGLHKFVKLALENNPNAIELLFTDESDHLYKLPIFSRLFDVRDDFLSTKSRWTFAGYARQQLKRIRVHRKWLLNPVEKKPERGDFNLPDNSRLIPKEKLQEVESQVEKKINEWHLDTTGLENDAAIEIKDKIYDILVDLSINKEEFYMYAARSIGLDDNLLEAFRRERQYLIALKEWKNYNNWKQNRNRARYELEKKFHYDPKHASHLVRLYKQCVELLRTGKLIVKRSDAEELLAIKDGAWTYDYLIQWADEQDKILNEAYKTSILPREPNRKKINDVVIDMLNNSE